MDMRKQGLIVVFYLLASVMRGQEDSASSRFRKALYMFKFSNFIPTCRVRHRLLGFRV